MEAEAADAEGVGALSASFATYYTGHSTSQKLKEMDPLLKKGPGDLMFEQDDRTFPAYTAGNEGKYEIHEDMTRILLRKSKEARRAPGGALPPCALHALAAAVPPSCAHPVTPPPALAGVSCTMTGRDVPPGRDVTEFWATIVELLQSVISDSRSNSRSPSVGR